VAYITFTRGQNGSFGNYKLFLGFDIFGTVVYLLINVSAHKNILS
jgi:hypothetical protein